jgi:hypothetical protein
MVGMWDVPLSKRLRKDWLMKTTILKEYNVSLDTKKRCVIRGVPSISKYHVQVLDTGRIIMDPMVMVSLKNLSEKTRTMLVSSMINLKEGKVGGVFNPNEFPEIIDKAEKAVYAK